LRPLHIHVASSRRRQLPRPGLPMAVRKQDDEEALAAIARSRGFFATTAIASSRPSDSSAIRVKTASCRAVDTASSFSRPTSARSSFSPSHRFSIAACTTSRASRTCYSVRKLHALSIVRLPSRVPAMKISHVFNCARCYALLRMRPLLNS
jgi:hypothetical protein